MVNEGFVICSHTNIRNTFSPGVEKTSDLLDCVEDDDNADNEDNNNCEGDGKYDDKVLMDILYSSFIHHHVLSLVFFLFPHSVRSNRIIHSEYFDIGTVIGRLRVDVVKVTCCFPRSLVVGTQDGVLRMEAGCGLAGTLRDPRTLKDLATHHRGWRGVVRPIWAAPAQAVIATACRILPDISK